MSLVTTANELVAKKALASQAVFVYDGTNPLSGTVKTHWDAAKRAENEAVDSTAPINADVYDMESFHGTGRSIVGYLEKTAFTSSDRDTSNTVSITGSASTLLDLVPSLVQLPASIRRVPVNFFVSAVETDINDKNAPFTQVPRLNKVLRAVAALDATDAFSVIFASSLSQIATFVTHTLPALNKEGRDVIFVYDGHNIGTAQASIDIATVTQAHPFPPFEYFGPASPSRVLVIPASVYSALAGLLVQFSDNESTGLISVSSIREWNPEAFAAVIPSSTRTLSLFTFGQKASSSIFYVDVITDSRKTYNVDALSVSPENDSLTLTYWSSLLGLTVVPSLIEKKLSPKLASFWDVDSGVTSNATNLLVAKTRSGFSQGWTSYDQITQGGIQYSAFVEAHVQLPPVQVLASAFAPQLLVVAAPDTVLKSYNPLALVSSSTTVVFIGKWPSAVEAQEKLPVPSTAGAVYAFDATSFAKESNIKPDAVFQALAADSAKVLSSSFAHKLDASKSSPSDESRPALLHATGQTPAAVALQPDASELTYSKANALKQRLLFPDAFDADSFEPQLRPDLPEKTFLVRVSEKRRLTPTTYDRNVFHIEFDTAGTGLTYAVGEALGVHGWNDTASVLDFIHFAKLNPDEPVALPGDSNSPDSPVIHRTVFQVLQQQLDIFGKPPRDFFANLAKLATNIDEERTLRFIAAPLGSSTFKKLSEVETVSYADVIRRFPSLSFTIQDLIRMIEPIKPRHYSIASSQNFVGDKVHLLVVAVDWKTPDGKVHFGQCTRYLDSLAVGDVATVSVRPSVMKLPPLDSQGVIMAGLGTGAAPFRAFIQERAWRQAQGAKIGPMLYYFGSRHRDMEYLYGEEIEAYVTEGIISKAGLAFSRDGTKKVYIQNKMQEDSSLLSKHLLNDAAFYLCGPTWPVPDVYNALVAAFTETGMSREDAEHKIDELKEDDRYVLEVY